MVIGAAFAFAALPSVRAYADSDTVSIYYPSSDDDDDDEDDDDDTSYVITRCSWDAAESTKAVGNWWKAASASSYSVMLFMEGKRIGDEVKTSSDTCDFTELVRKYGPGNYVFRVVPSPGGAAHAAVSDTLEVTDKMIEAYGGRTAGATEGTASAGFTGWKQTGSGWMYYENDVQLKNAWRMLDGSWRYFGETGALVFGEQSIGGKTYYFDTAGRLYTNTVTPGGYQVDENGEKVQ